MLSPNVTRLRVGETASLRAVIGELPAGTGNPALRWSAEDPPGADPHRSSETQVCTRSSADNTLGVPAFWVGLLDTTIAASSSDIARTRSPSRGVTPPPRSGADGRSCWSSDSGAPDIGATVGGTTACSEQWRQRE